MDNSSRFINTNNIALITFWREIKIWKAKEMDKTAVSERNTPVIRANHVKLTIAYLNICNEGFGIHVLHSEIERKLTPDFYVLVSTARAEDFSFIKQSEIVYGGSTRLNKTSPCLFHLLV